MVNVVSFVMIKVPDRDFYIGETPVTQQLWESIMGGNPSHFKHNPFAPVENISHDDCRLFIEKLNNLTETSFRLPTVDEWMFAARGKEQDSHSLYAGSNNPEEVGWFDRTTRPVKLKKPNSIGLFDMTGNVWEWTSTSVPAPSIPIDSIPSKYIPVLARLKTKSTYYYLKGGSCMNGYRNSRLVSENDFEESYRNWHLGMRLAI